MDYSPLQKSYEEKLQLSFWLIFVGLSFLICEVEARLEDRMFVPGCSSRDVHPRMNIQGRTLWRRQQYPEQRALHS